MLVFLYFVFFFKQKTAYEMRISDWSSDVCSSDLVTRYVEGVESDYVGNDNRLASMLATQHLLELGHEKIAYLGRNRLTSTGRDRFEGFMAAMKKADLRSEERRVGKESVSTCKSRLSPDHEKKKTQEEENKS